ncbi:MAG: hypothetical protein ACJ71Q_11450 [Terriglobales bacterium]
MWIPTNPLTGNRITGSATVTVLQPVGLNTDLAHGSVAFQTAGPTENTGVDGDILPSITSTDPSGNVQVRSGISIPVPCPASSPGCQ